DVEARLAAARTECRELEVALADEQRAHTREQAGLELAQNRLTRRLIESAPLVLDSFRRELLAELDKARGSVLADRTRSNAAAVREWLAAIHKAMQQVEEWQRAPL